MKLTLSITLDGAAFADNPGIEAGRILDTLASRLTDAPELGVGDSGPLRDINGNAVGTWQVEE